MEKNLKTEAQNQQKKNSNEKNKNEDKKKQHQGPKFVKKQILQDNKPGLADQMWQALILPPNKLKYSLVDLGPQIFIIANTQARREDFSIVNSRGHKMECSYFEPFSVSEKPHPVVIYLHGNSSSRLEGLSLLPFLLPIGVAVILMDFSGCGISEGDYISLGYYEKFDAALVIDHIKKTKNICSIGIWGRSMGAATALMLGTTRGDIDFIVADSPFICIQQLCQEVAKKQYKLPNFMAKVVWMYIKKKILKKANFDINDCSTIKYIKEAKFKPAILFLHAKDDNLIGINHSLTLFNEYDGVKNVLHFEGNHNSKRPRHVQLEVQACFKNNLIFSQQNSQSLKQLSQNTNNNNINSGKINSKSNSQQNFGIDLNGNFIVQDKQSQQNQDGLLTNKQHFYQNEQQMYINQLKEEKMQIQKQKAQIEIQSQQKMKNIIFQQPTMAKQPDNDDLAEPDSFNNTPLNYNTQLNQQQGNNYEFQTNLNNNNNSSDLAQNNNEQQKQQQNLDGDNNNTNTNINNNNNHSNSMESKKVLTHQSSYKSVKQYKDDILKNSNYKQWSERQQEQEQQQQFQKQQQYQQQQDQISEI